MTIRIPYGRQDINSDDIEAVVSVLKSDFLTQGPAIEIFEKTVAEACGSRYAVAVANATAGLHLGCLVLDLGRGDRLWTSPITFVASANAGLYCGAEIDFIDIHPGTLTVDVDALRSKLEIAAAKNRLPKVVMPVHFSGRSAEMREIAELAKKYGFTVIEDAAHGVGGSYENRPIGSCLHSDLAVLSFHPVKIVTTGEGGIVLTNRKDVYERLMRLRTHGITRDPSRFKGQNQGGWYYEQIDLGYNYRMTDIQAALGTSQMKRLESFIERRHFLADRYDRMLSPLPLRLPKRDTRSRSALHLYVVEIDSGRTAVTRREVYDSMIERGIGVNVHYIPVHLQPVYRAFGFKLGDFPVAEAYYAKALTLPLFPGLREQDQDFVVASLASIFSERL